MSGGRSEADRVMYRLLHLETYCTPSAGDPPVGGEGQGLGRRYFGCHQDKSKVELHGPYFMEFATWYLIHGNYYSIWYVPL